MKSTADRPGGNGRSSSRRRTDQGGHRARAGLLNGIVGGAPEHLPSSAAHHPATSSG
jgi:hypothetical protein